MKPNDILQLHEMGFWRAIIVVAAILVLVFLGAVASGLGKRVAEAVGWSNGTTPKLMRERTLEEWFEEYNGG